MLMPVRPLIFDIFHHSLNVAGFEVSQQQKNPLQLLPNTQPMQVDKDKRYEGIVKTYNAARYEP